MGKRTYDNSAVPKKAKAKRASKASSKAVKLPVTASSVRAAALAGRGFSDAEVALGLDKLNPPMTLEEVFKKHSVLAAAWERGLELYNVKSLAISGASKSEIAEAMAYTQDQFEKKLQNDKELFNVWNQARLQHLRGLRSGLTKSAVKGNQRAVETLERLAKQDAPAAMIDPMRMTVEQAAAFTGYSRQTLHSWNTKNGAPRNADDTVNLPQTIAWRIEFEKTRLSKRTGKGMSPADALHNEKLRKAKRENDEEEGRLVPLDQVMVTIIGLEAAMVNVLENQPRVFGQNLPGKTAGEIETEVTKFNHAARKRIYNARKNRDPIPAVFAEPFRKFIEELLYSNDSKESDGEK